MRERFSLFPGGNVHGNVEWGTRTFNLKHYYWNESIIKSNFIETPTKFQKGKFQVKTKPETLLFPDEYCQISPSPWTTILLNNPIPLATQQQLLNIDRRLSLSIFKEYLSIVHPLNSNHSVATRKRHVPEKDHTQFPSQHPWPPTVLLSAGRIYKADK